MAKFEKRILLFILSISLMLFLGVLAFLRNVKQSQQITRYIANSYEIIAEAQSLLSLLKEVESMQRGYIITGLNIYLEEYQDIIDNVNKHNDKLVVLTKNNSVQQDKVFLLKPLINQRISRLNEGIKIFKNQGFEITKEFLSNGQGRSIMKKIQQNIHELEQKENDQINNYEKTLIIIDNQTTFILIFVTTISLTFLCLIIFANHRYIISRDALEFKLNELVIKDELTKLYNRREMNRLLEAEISRCQRNNQNFCFVLVDLDHFKSINDNYGHLMGDKVLQDIAQIILTEIRVVDSAARFGGEEIAIILPNINASQAFSLVERIRKNLAKIQFISTQSNDSFFVTFSAGISEFKPESIMTNIIDSADKALYQAKSQGRNCTILALN
ncbi:MAG: diguanylate cyclase [Cyanobacteria bacterium]|nr:diguanylate cyclase [Cyanobacteria bacterium CG_2015-16_32_12]NCO77292.1 diguanylate cyclase [Cyanobacteria bacterium CG_2015-22_32_23]NCQ03816.1 diguanylate cyclase [Cyanobacteria bacterium CG_2015-09_32_10]NCQ40957.1 diguanylate cyclase [Cyanobacteria bacterium CG_2015-04_32_10]NCS86170.1 diguanylate cyclase [Cyanobacteria bacterium CG_2015-02_32_10]